MKRLSLSETARRFGISKGYLSKRVHAGKPAKGYDLHHYAAFQDGKVVGFDLPEHMIPQEKSSSQSGETEKQRETRSENVSRDSSESEGQAPLLEVNGDAVRDVLGMGERENPQSSSVAESIAWGMAAKESVDFLKDLRRPLQEADPDEAARFVQRLTEILMDVAPIAAGAVWAYLHQESSDVEQLAGALLAAAGTDVLVHGRSSMVARAFRGEPPEPVSDRSSRQSSDMGETAATGKAIAEEFMGSMGDGTDLGMEVGLGQTETESSASDKNAN